MRISDWSSDVCSSDLNIRISSKVIAGKDSEIDVPSMAESEMNHLSNLIFHRPTGTGRSKYGIQPFVHFKLSINVNGIGEAIEVSIKQIFQSYDRSEEHTSELQSLMRISYAVFCLKKKNKYQS